MDNFDYKAEFIEYYYKGNILKLSPINEVMKWKLRKNNLKYYK